MVNEEKELFKFVNNPKYRAKVIDRIHKERDREHEKKVKTVEKELKKLQMPDGKRLLAAGLKLTEQKEK